ncbi:MAG: M16 family metallopeptidase [Planctomycetota bacterium]
MEFVRHTLGNGLEIVAECNAAAHSAAYGFFVRTGARDETDPESGVSHFLEHMMFKGTPRRSADDVNREFDEMGAYYNAFTSEENTVYYAAVLPEFQGRVVELLADILRPALRDEDFTTEKQVILEEIQMYDDQPPFGADEKCRAAYFGAHPLGRSVLGTIKSITDLSVDQMRGYFDRRYRPSNIVLAAAGKVDFPSLLMSAEDACGPWEPSDAPRPVEPPAPRRSFHVLEKSTAAQQYLLRLSPGPSAEQGDRFAAKLLATILGDESGSRLYWELVDPGLAESVVVSHYEHQGAGVMLTYMSCEPDRTQDNLQRILKVFRDVQRDGVTQAELDQARSKIRSRIVLSSERPRGRMFVVGSDWIYRGKYRPVGEDLADVNAVTVEAIAEVLRNYPLDVATTVSIGPLGHLEQV